MSRSTPHSYDQAPPDQHWRWRQTFVGDWEFTTPTVKILIRGASGMSGLHMRWCIQGRDRDDLRSGSAESLVQAQLDALEALERGLLKQLSAVRGESARLRNEARQQRDSS